MSFSVGKNIQVCSERFLRSQSALLGETFDKRHIYAACLNRRDAESYCHAACVLKLLMIKRNMLYIPDNFLNSRSKDISEMQLTQSLWSAAYSHLFDPKSMMLGLGLGVVALALTTS